MGEYDTLNPGITALEGRCPVLPRSQVNGRGFICNLNITEEFV
jgi:hypothetical protein